jgi:hypothetical protein
MPDTGPPQIMNDDALVLLVALIFFDESPEPCRDAGRLPCFSKTPDRLSVVMKDIGTIKTPPGFCPLDDGPRWRDQKRSKLSAVLDSLPVVRVTATKQHSPVLLSYYFSALKEDNPLNSYIRFYNVLEYYFEDAPRLLARSAKTELEQLRCVIDLVTTEADVQTFLSQLDDDLLNTIHSKLQTSSGVAIQGLSAAPSSYRSEVARWLYEIRCSIVHSKRTRKGRSTSIFEPYSAAAKNVSVAMPLAKWLSILCIEKDHSLRAGL